MVTNTMVTMAHSANDGRNSMNGNEHYGKVDTHTILTMGYTLR